MEDLDQVRYLEHSGQFLAALETLDRVPSSRHHRLEFEVLRMELLERTGNYPRAQILGQRLIALRDLAVPHRSACECTLGLLAWHAGKTVEAIEHLQKAISLAASAKDLRRTCWAQLRLVVLLADWSGPSAAFQLLAEARANVIKLGDPVVSAALHIFVGAVEGKRGLVQSARRHTCVGQRLLSPSPNLWLEALAENNHAALAIISSDLHGAVSHAERGRLLAEKSGAAAMLRACLGNLGTINYLMGEFVKATEYLEHSLSLLPSAAEDSTTSLDSLARTYLVQNQLDKADQYLQKIDRTVRSTVDQVLYANRYSQLTAIELLMKQSRWRDALSKVEQLEIFCDKASDRLLLMITKIRKVETLWQLGHSSRAVGVLFELGPMLETHPPELLGHYERVLGSLVAMEGASAHAQIHFRRAERFFRGLRNAPGLIEVSDCQRRQLQPTSDKRPDSGQDTSHRSAVVLQDIAALMMHAGRPELLATGLVAILAETGSVEGAVTITRDEQQSIDTLASYGTVNFNSATRTFTLGTSRSRDVEVVAQPKTDLESLATLNAVSILIGTVRDLELAHAEREERLTLWPSDELPLEDQDAIIMGQMRDLMAVAQRVARTNVAVLITGESGTGKEIVARAVHKCSNRAKRPFVPFNCTAIPRELLESQLFGYRRGAFTGADRDNQGLIRTAQDGTLFLDEIGELGLDLQPKLLRLLESGEIHPLGEPLPLNVDVRIIAATNANLEQLVQDGRFREDLYYRLNVIVLPIPPLRDRRDEIPLLVHHFVARAAAEFSKGHVRVAEETMEQLLLYRWPGNVRQLHNELRRMVALADPDSVLLPAALSEPILRATPQALKSVNGLEIVVPLTDKLLPTLSKVEGEMIKVALRTNHGRVEAAARSLGISRKGLYLKRQRLGL